MSCSTSLFFWILVVRDVVFSAFGYIVLEGHCWCSCPCTIYVMLLSLVPQNLKFRDGSLSDEFNNGRASLRIVSSTASVKSVCTWIIKPWVIFAHCGSTNIKICSCIYKLIFWMSGLPSASIFPWVVRFVEPELYEMQECEYVNCVEYFVGFLSLNSYPLNEAM